MNLIDAIKSGRPFRRKIPDEAIRNLNPWIEVRDGEFGDTENSWHRSSMHLTEILADDWEIHEPTVTITRTQFDDVWAEYFGPDNHVAWRTDIARKLGLE